MFICAGAVFRFHPGNCLITCLGSLIPGGMANGLIIRLKPMLSWATELVESNGQSGRGQRIPRVIW
ncbi:MAG TPA: hypothetical protein VNE41_06265 [Chitinophagaceae bacterium]|nr:hypothetical protein [Chitinophagaceae bacterium]